MTQRSPLPKSQAPQIGAGFIYAMDQVSARRQLHLSLGVIVVLGIAILAAMLNLGPVPRGNPGYVAFLHGVGSPVALDAADRS